MSGGIDKRVFPSVEYFESWTSLFFFLRALNLLYSVRRLKYTIMDLLDLINFL